MYRRIVLAAVGTAVLALAGQGGTRAAFRDAEKDAHHGKYQKCARACADCTLACESCLAHCLTMLAAGHKDHARTARTCNDCGDFCALAAKITSRHGPMAQTTCEACAKVCDTCGEACEKFADDEHMVACAKACRECARECREMTKHPASEEGGADK
jgi:hypothetical protein